MIIINEFLFLLILFFPTFIANWVPVIIKNIPFLKDFNKAICEKCLWKNKTYRWFISWIFFWIISSVLLYYFLKWFEFEIIKKYYEVVSSIELAIITGFLQWFWALFWDSFKSYIKRKLWKTPWTAWPFWDGIDYIIWSLIFFSIVYMPKDIIVIFLLIIFAPIISMISNIISYILWLKDVWY